MYKCLQTFSNICNFSSLAMSCQLQEKCVLKKKKGQKLKCQNELQSRLPGMMGNQQEQPLEQLHSACVCLYNDDLTKKPLR